MPLIRRNKEQEGPFNQGSRHNSAVQCHFFAYTYYLVLRLFLQKFEGIFEKSHHVETLGRLLIKKKTCPFFDAGLAAAQLFHLSRLKKGHVFFLISNRTHSTAHFHQDFLFEPFFEI